MEGVESELASHLKRPEFIPFFDQMRMDSDDRVWLRRFDIEPEDRNWYVYQWSGELAARVVLPPELSVLDISNDLLVGLTEDDLGVQRVGVWRILRTDKESS